MKFIIVHRYKTSRLNLADIVYKTTSPWHAHYLARCYRDNFVQNRQQWHEFFADSRQVSIEVLEALAKQVSRPETAAQCGFV